MSFLPRYLPGMSLLFLFAFLAGGNEPPAPERKDPPAKPKALANDFYGDPLPAGAWARLGSSRLRHGCRVNALVFSRDGKIVASAGEDSIRLWEVTTGKQIQHLQQEWVTCIAFSPNGKELAAGSGIGIIRLWDIATGKEIRQFAEGTKEKILSLAFSPEGSTLATGTRGIGLWEVSTGKPLGQFGAKPVFALSFSAQGQWLASAEDSGIQIRETATGQERQKIPHQGPAPQLVAFANDGKTLILVQKNQVLLTDWTAGKEIRQFKLDSDGDGILAFFPEGKRLARVDANHTIHFLDENGTPSPSWGKNQSGIVSVNVSPGGNAVITMDSHGNVARRDLQSPKETSLFQVGPGGDGYLGLSPDGKLAARKLPNNYISIQDVTTSKAIGKIHISQGWAPERVVFSSDNKLLSVGCGEKPVSLYFLENLEKPTTLPQASAKDLPLLFSPDAKILVVGEGDHFIRLVATHSGKQLMRWKTEGIHTPVVFSPDNRLIATAGEEGVISLREVSTGQEIRFFQGHVGEVHGLAFSPDGRALASGGLDFLVKIWEVSSGQEVRRFQGHAGPVTALVFSPDGRSLITGSSDTTLLMWDITGRLQNPDFIPVSLEARQLESLWESLAGSNGSIGYDSIWKLVLLPKDSLPLLRERLQWYTEADNRRITKLIEELDDDSFAIREKASADLETMVKWAEPALRQALAKDPSLEVQKRIEKILEKLKKGVSWTQERLRLTRVIEILEKIGSREAEQGLEKLAKAAPDAEIRTEAQLALERLQKLK